MTDFRLTERSGHEAGCAACRLRWGFNALILALDGREVPHYINVEVSRRLGDQVDAFEAADAVGWQHGDLPAELLAACEVAEVWLVDELKLGSFEEGPGG